MNKDGDGRQGFLLTVMNDDGHFVRAEACRNRGEAMSRSEDFEDFDVTLIPCDSFEGFS